MSVKNILRKRLVFFKILIEILKSITHFSLIQHGCTYQADNQQRKLKRKSNRHIVNKADIQKNPQNKTNLPRGGCNVLETL